jgi:predicted GIY-YIG superfamily endonuclease
MTGPRMSRPRWAANYGPERGTTYLLHFDRPFRHARHYTGWTTNLPARLEAHGRGEGSRFMRYVRAAGIGFKLARTWPDTTRDCEDSVKHRGGASRLCPECGAIPGAPRLDTAKAAAEAADRRPHWQYDRDGEWGDGTPIIFDPDLTYEQARADRAALQIPEPGTDAREELAALDELERRWSNQEEPVTLREAAGRVAGAVRGARGAREREASADEADRLMAEADAIDAQNPQMVAYVQQEQEYQAHERRARSGQPNYRRDIAAERAGRVRGRIGADLARDADAQAYGPEVRLQGADLDAATGSEPLFGPRPDGTYAGAIGGDIAADPSLAAWDRYVTSQPGSEEHKAAYVDMHREAGGEGFGDPDPDQSYLADHGYETDADRFRMPNPEPSAGAGERPGADLGAEIEAPGEAPGIDAARWTPGLVDAAAAADADVPPGMEAWRGMPAGEIEEELSARLRLQANATPAPMAESFGRDLEEHAAAAAGLRRLETGALARAHIAQEAHDSASATAARQMAARMRQHRLDAEADAYDAAAAQQTTALNETPAVELTQAEEDYTRQQAAQLGRDPDEMIREAVQLKAEVPWDLVPAPGDGSSGRAPQPDPDADWEPPPPWYHPADEQADLAPGPGDRRYREPGTAARNVPGDGYQSTVEWDSERHEPSHDFGPRDYAPGEGPGHLYGSPQCAEADPETAHFGRGPGEPQDAGRWPVLQADYGCMYIGQPQYQAEAS